MGTGNFQEREKPTNSPISDSTNTDDGQGWVALATLDDGSNEPKDDTVKTDETLCWKYFQTICLCMAFAALGVCLELVGPALPTMAHNLNIEESKIYFILTTRGFGYFLGSLLSGLLLRKMSAILLSAISLTVNAVGQFVSPFAPSAIILSVVFVLIGMAMGALETSLNVAVLGIWGKESEVWMQTTHFCLAVGLIVAPIIAKPFIEDPEEYISHADLVLYSSDYPSNLDARNNTIFSMTYFESFTTVAWAYTIAAIMSATSALLLFFLLFTETKQHETSEKKIPYTEDKWFRMEVISLLFVIFLLNAGSEMTFGMYVYSFAIHSERRYGRATGAALNVLFMSAFATGCFVSIFLCKFATSRTMLIMDFVAGIAATAVMSLCSIYWRSPDWLLWSSIALFGLSLANVFPALITWAEKFITVNGSAASTFVVGCALGEMLVPFLVGLLFKSDPNNLIYFCLIANLVCAILFVTVWYLSKRQSEHALRNELHALIQNGPKKK